MEVRWWPEIQHTVLKRPAVLVLDSEQELRWKEAPSSDCMASFHASGGVGGGGGRCATNEGWMNQL